MASKKAVIKKKDKLIEDQTFGLKNKNKSKKVQEFIQRVEKTVKNSNNGKDAEKMKEAKQATKLAKQLQEEELRSLFNEGLTGQFGKKKSTASAEAKALGITECNKEIEDLIKDLGLDEDDEDEEVESKEKRGVIYIDDTTATIEVFKEKTIEDLIEEQRAKLQTEGKKGTPVTEESFAKWRAAKLIRKQEEAEERLRIEQSKKKGGRGLSVLSGKELFNFNAALFVDDDAAIDASEEKAMNEETSRALAEEERVAVEEAERAQQEQMRLVELERRYIEELQRKHDEKRQAAAAAASTKMNVFSLDGITINEIIFDVEDQEDLELFPDEVEEDQTEAEANNNCNDNENENVENDDVDDAMQDEGDDGDDDDDEEG
eukprot:gene7339-14984_t